MGKVQVNDWGEGGRDGVWRGTGVVVWVVYWRCLIGAVVRLMSCNAPLKASRLLCVGWKSVPLGDCSEKEAVFIVVVGGGYLSVFVWVIGSSCLAGSGHKILVWIDDWLILGYTTQRILV